MKSFIVIACLMLFGLSNTFSQGVIFIQADDREQAQIDFLEANGLDVTVMTSFKLSSEPQATYDALNAVDLIIIGRSTPSQDYRGADAQAWMDSITTPVILNSQWAAKGGAERINWFEVGNAGHEITSDMWYAKVDPASEIMTHVTPVGDSIPWFYGPHDYLTVADTCTYGTIAVSGPGDLVHVVQIGTDSAVYEGGDTAAGPRTYFGFGLDHQLSWDHFFPLTAEAQQVYLNEINRLMGNALVEAVITPRTYEPPSIVFIQSDDREQTQIDFLEDNGLDVFVTGSFALASAPQDTFDMLNEADVVIIGRSTPSQDYRGADAQAWMDSITTPVILNSQWAAKGGTERINWFEVGNAGHDQTTDTWYAKIDPANEIFTNVTSVGDSIPWMFGPHDYLNVADTCTYGTIAAYGPGDLVHVVQIGTDSAVYEGGDTAVGPRTYFGFGIDNSINWDHFFPLSDEAQQVYLNEIHRLAGVPYIEVTTVTPTQKPFEVIIVADDSEYAKEKPQADWLKAQGFEVTRLWTGKLSNLSTPEDTIALLNAADLVIIGRSGNSGDFGNGDAVTKAMWNDSVTVPVIANSAYHVRNSRLNWVNSGSVVEVTADPYYSIVDTNDAIFDNVTVDGDSMAWSLSIDDELSVADVADASLIDAKVLVSKGTNLSVARWDTIGKAYYVGSSDTVRSPRVLFAFGKDGTYDNYFPLTEEAQQVYFNEICRLLGDEQKEVVPFSTVSTLSSLAVSDGDLTPAFAADVYEYSVETELDSIEITATASNANAEVTGVGYADSGKVARVVVIAQSGVQTTYNVDIIGTGVSSIENELLSDVNIYPVPATSTLYVTNVRNADISIYQMNGALVRSMSTTNDEAEINVANLANGMYILKIAKEDKVGTFRFVKE